MSVVSFVLLVLMFFLMVQVFLFVVSDHHRTYLLRLPGLSHVRVKWFGRVVALINGNKPFLFNTRREGQVIDGNLHFNDGGRELTSLPKGLTVRGDLVIKYNHNLVSLPEGLKVYDTLSLEGCSGLYRLPPDLLVKGQLNLKGCAGIAECSPEVLWEPRHQVTTPGGHELYRDRIRRTRALVSESNSVRELSRWSYYGVEPPGDPTPWVLGLCARHRLAAESYNDN